MSWASILTGSLRFCFARCTSPISRWKVCCPRSTARTAAGRQLVIHEHPKTSSQESVHSNPVDGHDVPVPHFGVVLEWNQWEALAERLRSFDTRFVIEPYIRFKGQVGEQATMFLFDPCGNALEFKAFKDIGQLFAK